MAHTYWRINCTLNDGDAIYLSIAEVEMRATVGGADQCTGGTVSASTQDAAAPATNAFDNNNTTRWATGSGNTGWLKYAFASPVDVLEYTIRAHPTAPARSPRNWTFEWSDDDSAWTVADTRVGETGWTNGENRTYEVPLAAIEGTASITLGALTLDGAGTSALTGAASITLGALLSSGAAGLHVNGSADITLGALTVTGTGDLLEPIAGAASITLGALTASGTGVLVSPAPTAPVAPLPEIRPPTGTPVFLLNGHTHTMQTIYADVAMRTGQPRRRRVCTTSPRLVSVGWILESAEMEAVNTWFEETLLAGEREFSARVKGIGQTAGALMWFACKWVEPYNAEALHLGRWRVTGTLRVRGAGQVEDPYTPDLYTEFGAALQGSASLDVTPLFATEFGAELSVPALFASEFGAELIGEVEIGS